MDQSQEAFHVLDAGAGRQGLLHQLAGRRGRIHEIDGHDLLIDGHDRGARIDAGMINELGGRGLDLRVQLERHLLLPAQFRLDPGDLDLSPRLRGGEPFGVVEQVRRVSISRAIASPLSGEQIEIGVAASAAFRWSPAQLALPDPALR